MKLNDTKCKNIKPTEKIQKIADGDGLYFMVYPHGSKIGQFRYSYHGERKGISAEELPELLQKINQTASIQYFQTHAAIKLLMHTFVRTNELIAARWEEFICHLRD